MNRPFNLTVMMYHYVRDAGDAAEQGSHIPGFPKQKFSDQLDHLARDYHMVSWEDVRAALTHDTPLPERACLLTFDDGVCDHYVNVFPELARRHIAGLFFVMARKSENTLPLPHKLHYLIAHFGVEKLRDEVWERLDDSLRKLYRAAEARYRLRYSSEKDVVKSIFQRELEDSIDPLLTQLLEQNIGNEQELARRLFLNEAQVREMRAGGMNFGGHSQTHPWFDFISAARRQAEIRASQIWLSTVEQAPFAFAFPYGGLSSDAPDLLRQNGFGAAFTTREHIEQTDPFSIGRFDGEEWGA